ncbi:Ig-like domain-containing protein [Antarctobacter heliothermus]|uniref:Ca2+-binding protein, RTX toxin-related n=1 Tax=Antarctobacter heliothermus TaxID=74033 RepID=A0A239GH82_9RHOB|nr:Ig-like domain-containing protein [Antarctobacter heliothermus]SNS67414.1 Ca2+-binding protein, RTX toxin-related [Antarctobacter heliothermus]
MADLVLEWGALGPFGTNVADADGGVSASVDTGGVAVDISYDGLSAGSSAFTFNAPGYVAPDETFSNQSFLKLFGEGTGAASDTSTTVLDFRATDTSLYTDAAQNVSFRINDIDTGTGGDFAEAGGGFQDVVNVTALDPDGNPVPVTLTLGSGVTNAGGDLTGTPETGFEDATTSVLVEIAGPVASIQIEYANGAVSQQGVIISDIEFSTVDVDGSGPDAVDDTISTTIGEPVTIDPRDNDTDPDGDPLTVTGITPATNGTAVLNGDGTVTYTPNDGFTGTDTITYTITDGTTSDTATVTYTVTDDVDPNIPPTAFDDTAETDSGTTVTITPLANDDDPDGDNALLTVSSITPPANGTAVLNGDGTVDYTPAAGFIGTDTFTYQLADPDGGSDTGVITVTVGDPNAPPVAVADMAETDEGDPVVIDVLANDSDPDGDPLTLDSIATDPTNGTVALSGGGDSYTYTPDAGFTGTDTFSYTVTDGNGGFATAEVTITISEDAAPRIDTDVFPVAPGDQLLDPLNGLDQDPDPLDDLDNIVGDASDELIETGDDADTIAAGGGNDTVNPGIDNDYVTLGGGDDSLFDVQGADTIFGGSGNDTIIAGTDTFSDYEGDDPSFAPGTPLNALGFTADPNTEDGRDYVEGNLGDDSIATGDDADTIDGGGGNDTLDGGIDDDSIMGGQGDDLLIGSHGSDSLDGGQGNDTLDGSNFAALELTDDIDPNTENDRDLLQGFLGDDSLIGGDDDDTLQGGSGNDTLDGGIDDDILMGGNDDDVLIGGQGNDTLNGGSGDDAINGGSDRDVIIVDSAADGIGDTVDGGSGGFVDQANPEDPPNQDYDILDLSGVGAQDVDWRLVNEVADSNGNGLDGTIEFLDGSGAVTGTMDFFEIEEIVPCFTPGTLIATPQGERLVEDLEVGDRVITRDNGIQEIKWVGRKDLTGFDLARKPHFKPILIQQGALGNNLPEHDMLVSPNHRVLVANDKTALYFEEREVLVAAKHLTGLDGVDEVEANGVAYIHVMFEGHEVILSNGAWTESFQPGDYSLKGIGNAQRQEILELFPELEHAEGLKAYASARRSLKKHEAALLTK